MQQQAPQKCFSHADASPQQLGDTTLLSLEGNWATEVRPPLAPPPLPPRVLSSHGIVRPLPWPGALRMEKPVRRMPRQVTIKLSFQKTSQTVW